MRSKTIDITEGLPLFARGQLLLGLRISEILCLNCQDFPRFVNSGDSIMIKGKGNKIRFIPINQGAAELINILKGDRVQGALFLSQKGSRLTRVGAWYEVKAWCSRQGISAKGVITHSFRKGFATSLLKKGVNIKVIQELQVIVPSKLRSII